MESEEENILCFLCLWIKR